MLNQNATGKYIEEYESINSWYIAGHSLGGSMGSIYASKNKEKIEGLILRGSYPSADLSESSIKMISIYGSNDKILNRDSFENNKRTLLKILNM